jgi:anti-sigma-K factor RskA
VSHEEIQELLGAYALDAVDPDEAAAVEDHLRDCPRCRAEVAEHRETAAFLAHAGADAPPALWGRIAGAVDVPAPVVPLAPKLGPGGSWTRRSRWPAAVALVGAAAAIVIGVLVVQVRDQDARLGRMEAASDVFTQAMDAPGATVVHLDAGATELPVVMTRDGKAYLQAGSLPTLADGETYQLWGASGDDLVSVAVLGRNPDVIVFDVAGYSALAITEERAPGVVKTANEPIASGVLS